MRKTLFSAFHRSNGRLPTLEEQKFIVENVIPAMRHLRRQSDRLSHSHGQEFHISVYNDGLTKVRLRQTVQV